MGIIQILDDHPEATLAVVVVGGLLIGGLVLKKKSGLSAGTPGSTAANGATGLATDSQGRPIVYVPTSTSFSTQNIGAQFSNDPSLQSVSTGAITTNSPVSVVATSTGGSSGSGTPVITPIPLPPTPKPPVPPAPSRNPPVSHPAKYGLVWGALHTVTSDDTNHGTGALAYIASKSTQIMHTTQHAPSNVSISAGDIVSHNPGLRTNSVLKIGQVIKLPSYTRIS
jgi:hypothetical protein